MKRETKVCLIAMLLTSMLFISSKSYAAIWHVDNSGNDADFTSIKTAYESDSVHSDDTLYVNGTTISYGDLILIKKLHIIGPGYFLNENQDTQAKITSAKINSITYNPGSEGSSITGIEVINMINVYSNNITIRRNKIGGIYVNSSILNLIIVQNFIPCNTHHGIHFTSNGIANNVLISNNIIVSSNSLYAIVMTNQVQTIIKNNTISGSIEIHNSVFHNNIHCNDSESQRLISNCELKNNLADHEQFGSLLGNQSKVDMSTVFIGTGSQDGKWQLSENSPAKNAGLDGVDCGAFDGSDFYILSGIPMIPSIYYVDAPAVASELSGLPVHIKVKARN